MCSELMYFRVCSTNLSITQPSQIVGSLSLSGHRFLKYCAKYHGTVESVRNYIRFSRLLSLQIAVSLLVFKI